MRIDFGPGYRVYLGRHGAKLIILLGGSRKADQRTAISAAKVVWRLCKLSIDGGTPS